MKLPNPKPFKERLAWAIVDEYGNILVDISSCYQIYKSRREAAWFTGMPKEHLQRVRIVAVEEKDKK